MPSRSTAWINEAGTPLSARTPPARGGPPPRRPARPGPRRQGQCRAARGRRQHPLDRRERKPLALRARTSRIRAWRSAYQATRHPRAPEGGAGRATGSSGPCRRTRRRRRWLIDPVPHRPSLYSARSNASRGRGQMAGWTGSWPRPVNRPSRRPRSSVGGCSAPGPRGRLRNRRACRRTRIDQAEQGVRSSMGAAREARERPARGCGGAPPSRPGRAGGAIGPRPEGRHGGRASARERPPPGRSSRPVCRSILRSLRSNRCTAASPPRPRGRRALGRRARASRIRPPSPPTFSATTRTRAAAAATRPPTASAPKRCAGARTDGQPPRARVR